MRRALWGMAASLLFGGSTVALAADPDPAALEFFEKEVRPVLATQCLSCHGAEKQKAELRLDSRAAAIQGGRSGPAVVPGKPDESLLVDAVNHGDIVKMPPKTKLPAKDIAALTKWVAMGAPWPAEAAPSVAGDAKLAPTGREEFARRLKHWSLQPIRNPALPAVKDTAWPRESFDRFLLSALDAKGLKPAPEADRGVWLRRVTYDLTGLPPTPDEIAAFQADRSPTAHDRVVDRLLASPHYGERWARHWLDLVRFAETSGHEFDYDIPNAWRYRDYVIRALNADLSYDKFVTEHIAGDLLPEPRRHPTDRTNESVLATGFYFLGEGVHSPVDIRDDALLRYDNQIDVLSKTFLGLTVACARCHDHKFDAISAQDYYALLGVLQSSRHQQAFIDPPDRIADKAARLDALRADIGKRIALEAPRPEIARYLSAARRALDESQPDEGHSDATDIVFADFEGADYAGWTPTGTAFGEAPLKLPVPDYQGDVACRGCGLVGSHNGRVMGSVTDRDALTGTLTSPPFVIDRGFVHFLIGGGAHAGRTCVELLVDDRAVLSATGRNENHMRPLAWDVRPYRGRTARIRVVDAESGGWGNISLDHVVFSDFGPVENAAQRRVERIALRERLDPAQLLRWSVLLRSASERPENPFHLIGRLAATSDDRFVAVRDETLAALRRSNDDPGITRFADFHAADYGDWKATGDAFRSGPTRAGEWTVRLDAGRPRLVPIASSLADAGRTSDRLQGVLRSKTFTITKKYIHTYAAGRGGRINIVVEGFEKIRNPIYGGLTIGVDSEEPRTYTQDVGMWAGRRAYIELADGATLDYNGAVSRFFPGEGSLSVGSIVFTDGPAPRPALDAELVEELGRSGSFATLAKICEARVWAEIADGRRSLLPWLARANVLPIEPSAATARLVRDYVAIEATIPPPNLAPALVDGPGEDAPVHRRGSWRTLGPVVPRRFLEAVPGGPEPLATPGSGRLELARRITAPGNPLTARVIVNRVWKAHFGEGLVPTPDDFGAMGRTPSNPDLLDHLATRFVREGWSLKRLHREIVLSSAYRMSSRPDDTQAERLDPTNGLLHRMNVRRLEAEAIRDAMLAVSGRLDVERMYGPGTAPNLTPFMEGRGRPGVSGPVDGEGRRSLYITVRRNFLTPMLLAFDAPVPFSTIGRRNVSNVPAQALTLMNDPFVTGEARRWADRIRSSHAEHPEAGVTDCYRHAFGREPSAAEMLDAIDFLVADGLKIDPARAWGDFCHVLFNVKAFVFVD